MAATEYDFYSTRTDIIERALRLVGAIGEGDPATAEQTGTAILALNQIVKDWQNDHVFLWSVELLTLALVAGQEDYTLPNDPAVMWIDRAFYRDSAGHDTSELEVIQYRDYADIVDKAASGRPTVLALDSKYSPTAYVWPVPTETDDLYYVAVTRLKDWESASGNSGFDPRWDLALTHALASELAPEHGITKIGELQIFEQRAARAYLRAKGGNREHVTRTHVRSAFPRR